MTEYMSFTETHWILTGRIRGGDYWVLGTLYLGQDFITPEDAEDVHAFGMNAEGKVIYKMPLTELSGNWTRMDLKAGDTLSMPSSITYPES